MGKILSLNLRKYLISLLFRVIDIPTKKERWAIMMYEKLRKAVDDFITQRLCDLGTDSPAPVTEAITNVKHCSERLAATLTKGQHELWLRVENSLSLQTGEEMRYYYKSGFYDAIHFLLGWDRI